MKLWDSLPPPRSGLRAVIIVPVRNEADHLGAALQALIGQTDFLRRPFDRGSYEVIVLANNCDDESAAIARRFARECPNFQLHVVEAALPTELAHIGYVRRRLMDEACRRLEIGGCDERAILSTDGDTHVAQDWLDKTLQELRTGADAVGGRIFTDSDQLPSAAALRIRRLDSAHSLLRSRLESLIDGDCDDPWPRHHQHFGASLAVTANAYRLAGGVPDVPYLEDEALVRALRRVDLKVRHSPLVRVTTSSRLEGRVAVGLSWQLRQWSENPDKHATRLFESADCFANALLARVELRRMWSRRARTPTLELDISTICVAEQLGVAPKLVFEAMANANHFGEAWEMIESLYHESTMAKDWVRLPQALMGFRRLVRDRLAN